MRYIPHTNEEIKEMIATIGAGDVEDLFRSIPSELRSDGKLHLPEGMSEPEIFSHLSDLAMKNRSLTCSASFLGAGCYRHYVPAAVAEIASRSEFVTPYTPYQPEVSQGTLGAIFAYQSQICRLFDMEVSNASHYSGATACADAALMSLRVGRKRTKLVVADTLHPEYREVLATTINANATIALLDSANGRIDRMTLKDQLGDDVAAVVVQYPNFFGIVEDFKDVADMTHEAGALLVAVVPEPTALGILTPPGAWGADIAVGEGLSLGLATNYGGPTLGIFTTREKYIRQMPGRVCGKTVDEEGRPGYVLTLSTREQHIRRERATSNICTNQALCATQAAIYLAMLGKNGIRELAQLNAAKAAYAKQRLADVSGVTLPFDAPTFNEFVIETPKPAADVLARLADEGIFGGVDLGRWYPERKNQILTCTTELNTREEIDRYAEILRPMVR